MLGAKLQSYSFISEEKLHFKKSFSFQGHGKGKKGWATSLCICLPCVARLWRSLDWLSRASGLEPGFTQVMEVIGHIGGIFDLTKVHWLIWNAEKNLSKCNMTLQTKTELYHVKDQPAPARLLLLFWKVSRWTKAYRFSSSSFRTYFCYWTGR